MLKDCAWVWWAMEVWVWSPPAGLVIVGAREGPVYISAIDAELAVRVAWTAALMVALTSTVGVVCRGRAEDA